MRTEDYVVMAFVGACAMCMVIIGACIIVAGILDMCEQLFGRPRRPHEDLRRVVAMRPEQDRPVHSAAEWSRHGDRAA